MMDPSLPLLKREGETKEILLADLSYSNQSCLHASSEVVFSRIRTNNQGDETSEAGLSLHKHAIQTYIDSKKE